MEDAELIETAAGHLREQIAAEIRQAAASGEEVPADLTGVAERTVDARAALLTSRERRSLVAEITRQTSGLGPLEDLIADPEVEEVMVNGCDEVYVERRGRIERAEVAFEGPEQLRDLIERVLAPIGRRVDELSPMADGRLPDGSRINVVLPPLAVDGPVVSIRRFRLQRPRAEQLVQSGTLTPELFGLLAGALEGRRNLVICGGTGSGKTTVLGALSSLIADGERIITIEDAAELDLRQPHVVRLESRPPGVEGRGGVTIRDLVRNALRMRPDRLVIGEVRGPEALDLITALNTGHSGALSTLHANGPQDAVARLETLALTAASGLPLEAIRSQLARALDLILHLERGPGGARQATTLGEVYDDAGQLTVRTLWSRPRAGGGRE